MKTIKLNKKELSEMVKNAAGKLLQEYRFDGDNFGNREDWVSPDGNFQLLTKALGNKKRGYQGDHMENGQFMSYDDMVQKLVNESVNKVLKEYRGSDDEINGRVDSTSYDGDSVVTGRGTGKEYIIGGNRWVSNPKSLRGYHEEDNDPETSGIGGKRWVKNKDFNPDEQDSWLGQTTNIWGDIKTPKTKKVSITNKFDENGDEVSSIRFPYNTSSNSGKAELIYDILCDISDISSRNNYKKAKSLVGKNISNIDRLINGEAKNKVNWEPEEIQMLERIKAYIENFPENEEGFREWVLELCKLREKTRLLTKVLGNKKRGYQGDHMENGQFMSYDDMVQKLVNESINKVLKNKVLKDFH